MFPRLFASYLRYYIYAFKCLFSSTSGEGSRSPHSDTHWQLGYACLSPDNLSPDNLSPAHVDLDGIGQTWNYRALATFCTLITEALLYCMPRWVRWGGRLWEIFHPPVSNVTGEDNIHHSAVQLAVQHDLVHRYSLLGQQG